MVIHEIEKVTEIPTWTSEETMARFLHEHMHPYQDDLEDIRCGLNDALSNKNGKSGFILIGETNKCISGLLVMLPTGMKGYIPENVLLYCGVHPDNRNQGCGQALIERALDKVAGSVKLHVEYDNPARKLYERLGFTTKYAEMRYPK